MLIGRYKHMVYTVASRVMRNSMDAEEVTQDVFVKAFQKLNEFQGVCKFSTWLYSIAYRMSISALRARKDQGSSLDDMKTSGVEPREDPLHPVDDRKQILEQALTTLEPDDARLGGYYQDRVSKGMSGCTWVSAEHERTPRSCSSLALLFARAAFQ